MTGVHPAEHRLGQPVDDLVAQPRSEQLGDRHVGRPQGQHRLGARPGQAVVGEHAGRRQGIEVERYAEQRARQGPERAAGPDLGRPRGRVDHVEPQLGDQPDGLGAAREHRLGADVDDVPRRPRASRSLPPTTGELSSSSTDIPDAAQLAGRHQAGDTAAHHHHVGSLGHGATLAPA